MEEKADSLTPEQKAAIRAENQAKRDAGRPAWGVWTTGRITASHAGGGLVASPHRDLFAGTPAMCVTLPSAAGPCQPGNPNHTMYNQNGAPSVDAPAPVPANCTNRQYV